MQGEKDKIPPVHDMKAGESGITAPQIQNLDTKWTFMA
jgi:hypothetical protein